ncbi:LysR family transcriptional regulator [uncultured Alsobacter sp.]|uniref:LysR family transcriptional regulator n=1 Tax=uncultured Alsobacter sp. TaxID=1748258 RepID=UPI0025F21196|nr:LysR family transcriptional regulator [uncultured Alsobacter sp.]
MEMHQVRYFLAAARTLNFTRAAEECNVAQPSLTRAIKLLEEELGGDLFRREHKLSHLTDLGERMLPLLQQCYEAAQGVKQLAHQIRRGEVASLRIALSHTIDITTIVAFLAELTRAFPGLELKFLRGTGDEVAELLKKGEADLAIAGGLGVTWDRLDTWALFTEDFALLASDEHALAGANAVDVDMLVEQRLLVRPYCEQFEQIGGAMRQRGINLEKTHAVGSERDMIALLEAGIGVAIAPRTTALPKGIHRIALRGLPASRTVSLHAVAGRQRDAAATALMKLLRGADWSRYIH